MKNAPRGLAVVTGASSGIGAVYADRLAHRGFDVLLVARDATRLKHVGDGLSSTTGRNVTTLVADLTKKADLLELEGRLRTNESVTMLVNNAGFGGMEGLLRSNVDELENMIALNVTALTRLTLAVLPGFVERNTGTIINVASVVALNPEALNGTYSGTKAYVVNFTQALYDELHGTNVQVQAVLPGATRTRFWDRAGTSPDQLPREIVMSADDCVDAALVGLERHELVTIPALADETLWNTYDDARRAMYPYLAKSRAAERYLANTTGR